MGAMNSSLQIELSDYTSEPVMSGSLCVFPLRDGFLVFLYFRL